ncbi:MAG: hypothetical protein OIF47_02550 [Marinibacterium sp.]|nr:hypothetical protein [Marinibacterium sp.]
MGYPTKIVTCCYCGTRAALVLKGRDRHELACASCGAPLHALKNLPRAAVDADAAGPARSGAPWQDSRAGKPAKPRKQKKKRKKSLFRKAMSEAFDLIEDILD